MNSQFLVTTTTTVVLNDLGQRTLTHPVSGLDLLLEYSQEDLANSADLATAITNGHITVVDENSNPITAPATQLDYVLQDELDQHAAALNPHNTTAAAVGAEPADAAIQTHLGVVSGNPHGTSAADVGAIPTAEKGAANGVAPLNSAGVIDASHLPYSGLNYKGTWNATTNTPALSNGGGGGAQGDYYVVLTSGITVIDGQTDWERGDWIVNNGSFWQKVDNTDSVSSVAGKQGAVVLVPADVSLGNVTNDAQLKRADNDWSGFAAMSSPASGDHLLLERASDGAKRRVTVANVGAAGVQAAISAHLDRHYAEETTPDNNPGNSYETYLTHTFNAAHTKVYRVGVHFVWSLNTTSRDFMARLQLNGVTQGVEFKAEPKDSGGSGPYGTSQRIAAQLDYALALSAGSNTIRLQYMGERGSDNPAIYEARMYIERWSA